MNFIIYDVGLLVIFAIFISIFLYKKRKKLDKEGSLILYRTQWGVKLIDKIGGKYKKVLNALSYVSILGGYVLMISIVYLIVQTVYIYFTSPLIKQIKIPPIMPLIPYIDKLVPGLPTFYFVYFAVAVLIVATVHEFSHGIFARCFNINIKSTGFAFFRYFPAFFGAFVEQDETQMNKKKKFEQMSVLSAGVFANIITAVVFFFILVGFFSFAFSSSGVVFTSYAYSPVNISEITSINGFPISEPTYEKLFMNLEEGDVLNKFSAGKKNYLITYNNLKAQEENEGVLVLYDDAPAINAKLNNIISEINGIKIKNLEDLSEEISRYSPGDEITIKSKVKDFSEEYEIILEENPETREAWLGVGFGNIQSSGILGKVVLAIAYFKKPYVYYEPNFSMSWFFYDLFWWIAMINLLVAMFNMLPLGILDGGRFFYLTILWLTKSEKISKRFFSTATAILIFAFLLLMIRWLGLFLFKI